MPYVQHTLGRDFNTYDVPDAKQPDPTLDQTVSSAFRLHNDVANVAALLSAPAFPPDPAFNVGPALRDYDTQNGTSYFQNNRDRFLGVTSKDEMLHGIGKLTKEAQDQDTLTRAGWLGTVASVSAGLASPTLAIPFVGAETGIAAVARGAIAGAAASAASETALYENQMSRTPGDVAIGIGAGTVMGGILGGASSFLHPGEAQGFEDGIKAAANPQVPQSVGAAAAEPFADAGGLASGAKTLAKVSDATRLFTNPVTQNINQEDSQAFRLLTQQLSDSGLRMEGNEKFIPTSTGGTIENNLNFYTGRLVQSDEHFNDAYSNYFFDGKAPSFAPDIQASLSQTFNATGKLSKGQFADEVTRAIWAGNVHDVPEVVEAAKTVSKDIYEPMLKEAQAVGLYPEDVKVVGDEAYANRIYNNDAIKTYTQEFVQKLSDHYEGDLQTRWKEELGKFQTKQSQQVELAQDLKRPADEVQVLQDKFRESLKTHEEGLPEDISNLETAVANNRATARRMLENNPGLHNDATRKQLLKDALDMEKSGGDKLKEVKAFRTNARRRLRNLSQSVAVATGKRARKLEVAEALEDKSHDALYRVVRKAQSTLRGLDKWSDKKLDDELENLKNTFQASSEVYDRGEQRLSKLAADEDGDVLEKMGDAEALQQQRASRLNSIADKLEHAQDLAKDGNRELARSFVQQGLEETLDRVNELNLRKAARASKLRGEAATIDPRAVATRATQIESALPGQLADFERNWETKFKADSVDAAKGTANFKTAAREAAEKVKDTILGTYSRLPYSDVMQQERGSELRRVLHIPSKDIDKFLEKDIRKLTKSYTHTLGPDIEIQKKFGTLNMGEVIQPAVDELNAKIAALKVDPTLEGEAKIKAEKKIAKQTRQLNDNFQLYKNNFTALIDRLRGTRGLPSNPEGYAYRAARTIMNLNVLRDMGMVTISSFPDLARPVMRYGLLRTFRDGWLPLLTNFKDFKVNVAEAKLAGVATESSAHMRALAFRDVADDMTRGSKFEKSVEYATQHMGTVALFEPWTRGMEMVSSSITNAKIMDALAVVNTGSGNLSKKAAETFLAENGFDGNLAERAWKDVTDNGGGAKVNGVWMPNTESWKDFGAMRAYRQALAREVYNTIPRPGLERALLSDVNMVGKMLYQFKSFGMSAMPKVMMAGMQQRDAAAVSGALASLGMGAMSYFLYAHVTGGRALDDMKNGDARHWADAAINRSGLISGFIGEGQNLATRIPLLQNISSFSGGRATKRPGDNVMQSVLGPSFNFGQNVAGVLTSINSPTQQTLQQFSRLVPFQNTIGLREGIDAVQNAVGKHLPERN